MKTATLQQPIDVFEAAMTAAWPHRFRGRLQFRDLVVGGTPTNEKVAEGWIRSKMQTGDEAVMNLVLETMAERVVDRDEAMKIVGDLKLLKGFKKDQSGLYLDGRTLKACLKEGASIAQAGGFVGKRGWGQNNAGLKSFVAEHIMVVENKLHLLRGGKPVTKPDEIQQRFVHTFKGSGITYEEVVERAEIEFTIITDSDSFDHDFWAQTWLKAREQGLGASRSMGFGRFWVTQWERVEDKPVKATRKRASAAA